MKLLLIVVCAYFVIRAQDSLLITPPVTPYFPDVEQENKANLQEDCRSLEEFLSATPDTGISHEAYKLFLMAASTNTNKRINETFVRTDRKGLGLSLYRNFLLKNPGNYGGRLGFAQLLGWSDQFKEAIALYREALREKPGDEAAALGLAATLGWNRQYDEAEKCLREFLESNPGHEDARIILARLLSWQQRYDEAIDILKSVLEKNPQSIYGHEAIAFIYKWRYLYGLARNHFMAISRLEGDPDVIRNARLELAELDWIEGKNLSAKNAFEALASSYPTDRVLSTKSAFIDSFLRTRVEALLFRYQELGVTAGSSISGIANNGASLLFRKNLSMAWSLGGRYQIKNETSSRFSEIQTANLYDLEVHQAMVEGIYRYRENVELSCFYAPSLYRNRSVTSPKLPETSLFHGAGFFGHVEAGRGPLYFAFTLKPMVVRSASAVGVERDLGLSFSYPAFLPKSFSLSPTVECNILEDNNVIQAYRIELAGPIPETGLQIIGKLAFRGFNELSDRYFSYNYWACVEGGLAWDGPRFRRRFSVPLEARASFNRISLAAEDKNFAGFGLSAIPAFAFPKGYSIQCEITIQANTDSYYVYYVGFTYGM